MNKYLKKILFILLLALLFLAIIFYFLKVPKYYPKNIQDNFPDDFFGVTYSKKYAKELGLDWQQVYLDILDDLNVKKIRIPIYWDEVEKEEGFFDFSDYIFMIEEGEQRDVEFILSFGMRVPRWPECHIPAWINVSDVNYLQGKTLILVETVLNTFKGYNSIAYWQLENEPLLNSFGMCPKADYSFLQEELKLVKSIDDRPVIISATGELSFWKRELEMADIFGTTMYRVVRDPYLGYIKYPYTVGFYKNKAKIWQADFDNIFIAELQAEPWMSMEEISNIYNTEHFNSFSLDQFRANLQFAYNTGFNRAYLWGVEWWYFRHKIAGDSSYWNLAKNLFD